MGENKLVTTTEPKTFHFDLPKYAGINRIGIESKCQ